MLLTCFTQVKYDLYFSWAHLLHIFVTQATIMTIIVEQYSAKGPNPHMASVSYVSPQCSVGDNKQRNSPLGRLLEFSHNYNMENIENLECVKSIAETNFKTCLIINTQGFHHKEFSQIFYRSLQFVCKLKNQPTDFPYFP